MTTGLKQSTVSGLLSGHPLQLLSRDREKEHQALKRLRQWAYSITPTLSLWRDDCLQLEISRCLLVHGGLEALLKKLLLNSTNADSVYSQVLDPAANQRGY